MITLITGLPGHGKTLRLVHELMSDAWDGRPRFVCGIDGLDLEKTNAQEFDAREWQQLPDKAVAFVDECYKWFPARSSHQRPPEYVEKLAEHRHQGIDFVFCCQDPSQVDPFMRRLVDRHLHCKRNFGYGFTNIREFQGVKFDPGGERARKEAVTIKRWKFPKKLFGLYQSATAHTVKRRVPVKLVAAVAAIVAMVAIVGNLVAWAVDFHDEDQVAADPQAEPLNLPATFEPVSYQDIDAPLPLPGTDLWDSYADQVRAEYYAGFIEAVPGIPWTQARYHELQEPVSWPKPHCILMDNGFVYETVDQVTREVPAYKCVCHSQQGTRLDIDLEICQDIVAGGFFDPTLEDADLLRPGSVANVQRPRFVSDKQTSETRSKPKFTSNSPSPNLPHTNWNFKGLSDGR